MTDNHTDFNLVVLCGSLAVEPEYRSFDSGARLIRYLVTTRSSEPVRRTDVIPITQWDPPDPAWERSFFMGERVMVIGTVQRRFWNAVEGRKSRLEVVASSVEFRDSGCLAA